MIYKSTAPRMTQVAKAIMVSAVALLATNACTASLPAGSGDQTATSTADAGDIAIVRLDSAINDIIAPGATIERIAGGYEFVEGPVWTNGELWFSDLMGNKLYAIGANGVARLLLDNSGGVTDAPHSAYPGSNGAAVNQDGSVLMAQHAARRIARVASDMSITPFVERDGEGRRLNSPNDMVFAPDGALWFTDPPLGLANGNDDPLKEIPYNGVYRLKDGKVTAAITDLPTPNGIALSPDGKQLYVSNSGPNMFINIYDVDSNGNVANGRSLIRFDGPSPTDVPDGMKVDSRGNIWASGPGGIRIITPQGKVLGQLKTPDPAQANLAWGGEDGRTAYITASNNVYRLQLAIPGLQPKYGE